MVDDDAGDSGCPPGEERGRFPAVDEDRRPRYLVCTELPGTAAFQRLLAHHPVARRGAIR